MTLNLVLSKWDFSGITVLKFGLTPIFPIAKKKKQFFTVENLEECNREVLLHSQIEGA
jgi:hypothetical protein